MSIFPKTRFRIGLVAVVVTFTAFLLVRAEVPKGWYLAGSKPAEYESSVDDVNTFSGRPSAYLRSREAAGAGWVRHLMQNFSAEQYIGKRVRFGAFVKSKSVERWSGLWMRVDGKSGQPSIAFDHMLPEWLLQPVNPRDYAVLRVLSCFNLTLSKLSPLKVFRDLLICFFGKAGKVEQSEKELVD